MTNNANMLWAENAGSGIFPTSTIINTPLGVPRHLAIGDINSNGSSEIVYTSNSTLGYMTINNNGTFSAQTTIGPIGTNVSSVLEMADFDGDGDLDIVANSATGQFYMTQLRYYQNLGNSFAPYTLFGDEDLIKLLVTDINGDGRPDLIGSSYYSSEIILYTNMGMNANLIKGTVSLDLGANNCTAGSIPAQQVMVTTVGNNSSVSTFTAANGAFAFPVDAGNYTTSVTSTFQYFTASLSSTSSTFAGEDGVSIADFCLVPSQSFTDLEISFYPLNDARPGFNSEYLVVARNKGTQPITTTVTFEYNGEKITFLNSDPAPSSQSTNTVVFNIENLQPFQSYNARLEFQVHTIPTVTIGESIVFNITNALSGDISADNNSVQYPQTIVGSYDPNDIVVLEGEEVHIDNSDAFLHYIIRFKNTGNYFAERVRIMTILDDQLDWQTMELEAASHANRVEIIDGSAVNFVFDAIYLPSMSANEEDSKGFVAFKIKPKPTVVSGDSIEAEAAIYFDYNPAINTNEVATTFVSVLDVANHDAYEIGVYPNPVSSLLYLNNIGENATVAVYNILGIKVDSATNSTVVDFTEHAAGIYIIRVTSESGTTKVFKVIKK
jgi:hypothetical protein